MTAVSRPPSVLAGGQEPARSSTYKVELNSRCWNTPRWVNCRRSCGRCAMRGGGGSQLRGCMFTLMQVSTPRAACGICCRIMYSKEDLILKAVGTQQRRVEQYCHLSRENVMKVIRNMPPSLTMEQLRRAWYEGRDGAHDHYNWSRYYALNLHSVFYHGTVEWRSFESTLHAGEVRADITLALAMSAQAINLEKTVARKTPVGRQPGVCVPNLFAPAGTHRPPNTRTCGCICSSACPVTRPGCATATSTKATIAAIPAAATLAEGGDAFERTVFCLWVQPERRPDGCPLPDGAARVPGPCWKGMNWPSGAGC